MRFRVSRRAWRAVWCVSGAALLACSEQPSAPVAPDGPALEAAPPSVALGAWRPGPGECSTAVHDRYSTIGPDGKRYPTWHPPVDPLTGCSFGHEHGRDPRGSALYREVGDLPFGYVNEQLDVAGLGLRRHEDHVGHKIEWENDIVLRSGGGAGQLLEVRCDVMTKLHQGTHSKDAFTNNLHELNYHLRCSDRTEMHVALLTAIGRPGEFERTCGGTVTVGPATPVNSPAGGGKRRIPEWSCVEPKVLVPEGRGSDFGVLHESWETHSEVRSAEGNRVLASFDPYFQVFRPSRYFDPRQPDGVARPAALCTHQGHDGRRARTKECDPVQQAVSGGAFTMLPFDDPRSPFNGARRQVDINNNKVRNAGGPRVWYTDPFGRQGRRDPFPGSVRQVLSAIDNDYGVGLGGPVIGGDRSYGGPGTRAPN